MFSKARWRLTAVSTAILVVILAVAGGIVYFTTSSLIYDRVDAELTDKAQSQSFLLHEDHHDNGGSDHDGTAPSPQQFDAGGYSYAILDTSGKVTDSSYGFDSQTLAPSSAIDEARRHGKAIADVTGSDGQTYRVYLLAENDGPSDQVLQIGRSLKPEQDDLSQLRDILVMVVFGSIIPAAAGGYLISGRILRPIQKSVDAQRAFIADASHELRTPVAVVRTNAELLERRMATGKIGQSENDSVAVGDILAETERLGKMVSQMLTLAQADAGQSVIGRGDLDVDEIALEVVRSMRAIADEKGVMLGLQNGHEVWVNGDRDRLREVIVTVLDNAVKYTPSGGHVNVRVERQNRKALIAISDTGAGIPPADLPHIFERFYRVDTARSREEGGTGLGLAIARHIVLAHGGDIRIDSRLGQGTTVTIELKLLHERQPDAAQLADEPHA